MTDATNRSPSGNIQAELTPDQLARMNRLSTMARLVAGLTHELNNSLQVIGGLSELLIGREDLPPEAQAKLRRIGAQAGKAAASIRRVQSFTRENSPAVVDVDLVELLEEALSLRSFPLERAGVEVSVTAADGPARVRGDRGQLSQLLLNLLLNVEDALEGHPAPRARFTITRHEGHVRLTVSDNGEGLTASVRQRAAEPFVSTRRSERSLGLGVTVAEAIAAAHDGRLWFDEVPSGATVVLELPALP
jgi:C4-dicarboxylate-specific signal transduction histidine kinase